jgi:fatty acyl-CoA reductase
LECKFSVFLLQLFHRLRKEKPDVLNKVVPVHGDITLQDLGLTPEAKSRLQDEVSVVFHCAATLRLEAKLKDAVEMNTAGTWRILQLARGMTQLKVRLDDAVSTAVSSLSILCANSSLHVLHLILVS